MKGHVSTWTLESDLGSDRNDSVRIQGRDNCLGDFGDSVKDSLTNEWTNLGGIDWLSTGGAPQGGQGGRPPPQLEHWGGIAPPTLGYNTKGCLRVYYYLYSVTVYTG